MTEAPAQPTSLRERKKALTRQAIEREGLRLFTRRGYDETTVDDICEAAMVARRTFFRYFASKEDVLLARLQFLLDGAAASLSDRPATEPVADSLRVAYLDAIAVFEQNHDQFLEWTSVITETPSLSGAFLRMIQSFEAVVREFLEARADAGFDPRDAPLVAAAMVAAMRVAIEAWRDSDGSRSLRKLVLSNMDRLIEPALR